MVELASIDFSKRFWIIADIKYSKKTEEVSQSSKEEAFEADVLWLARSLSVPSPKLFVQPRVGNVKFHFIHLVKSVTSTQKGVMLHLSSNQGLVQTVKFVVTITIEPNKHTEMAVYDQIVFAAQNSAAMKGYSERFCPVDMSVPTKVAEAMKRCGKDFRVEVRARSAEPLESGASVGAAPKDEGSRLARIGSKRAASMVQIGRSADPSEQKKLKSEYKSAYRPDPIKDAAWIQMRKAQGRDTFDDDFTSSRRSPHKPDQMRSSQTTISSFFPRPAHREGFKNLGNSCYMGAVVSVLVALKPFVTDMERFLELLSTGGDTQNLEGGGQLALFNALLGVCRRAGRKGHGVLDLTMVKQAVGARARRFAGREQQDAHEFYAGCLDLLSSELRRVAIKSQQDANPLPLPPRHGHHISQDNFSLRVKDTLKCLNPECAYRRSRTELSLDLSLSLPEPPSEDGGSPGVVALSELVDAFFADNHLECKCDKCGTDEALATHTIKSLPRHLVVHLKRFRPNWQRQVLEKVHRLVDVPLRLDLSRHCSPATRPPATTHDAHKMPKAASPDCSGPSLETPRQQLSKGSTAKKFGSASRTPQPASGSTGTPAGPAPTHRSGEASGTGKGDGAVVVDDADESVQRKLDFDSRTRGTSSQEERDVQRAIELSALDASVLSATDTPKLNASFDHRQFSLGDEEEDLRRALELSQAAATDIMLVEDDDGPESGGGGDAAMISSDGDHESSPSPGPEEAEEDDGSESEAESASAGASVPSAEFALHAVVSHLGHSATSGHYVSDVWDGASSQWQRFDDDLVTPLREAVRKSRQDWQRGGYLLVYSHASCFRTGAPR